MRFWILALLLNMLFQLTLYFITPAGVDIVWYTVGVAACALIALVITWNAAASGPGSMLFDLLRWGAPVLGVMFFLWGAGVKLEFWGLGGSGEFAELNSYSDSMISTIALLTGPLAVYFLILQYRSR